MAAGVLVRLSSLTDVHQHRRTLNLTSGQAFVQPVAVDTISKSPIERCIS